MIEELELAAKEDPPFQDFWSAENIGEGCFAESLAAPAPPGSPQKPVALSDYQLPKSLETQQQNDTSTTTSGHEDERMSPIATTSGYEDERVTCLTESEHHETRQT